jgi:uncharacterized DUF497 family protein
MSRGRQPEHGRRLAFSQESVLLFRVRFTWAEQNAAEHLSKHGEEAETAYDDPDVYFEPNIHHPERMNSIGYSNQERLLYVVTVEIIDNEHAEIITAWLATPAQRKRYEGQ